MDTGVLMTQWLQAGPSGREDWRQRLMDEVNYLLLHDFERLVHLLYRVDVDEKQLKQCLRDQQDQDAAVLITDLLLQRLEQKEASRRHTPPAPDLPDEERW